MDERTIDYLKLGVEKVFNIENELKKLKKTIGITVSVIGILLVTNTILLLKLRR